MTDDLFIDKYLTGRLSERQENHFFSRLKKDSDFKDKVLATVILVKAMREVSRTRDKRIIDSMRNRLTWKKYILVYGIYSTYYFSDNMKRYNTIFPKRDASYTYQ